MYNLKQKQQGPAKKLVGLEIESRAIARAGDPVLDQRTSKTVGKVTSGTFSPTLQKPVALAYLAAAAAAPGTEVGVEVRKTQVPAKVVAKTFYKR